MAQTQPTSNKPSRASSDVDLAAKLQAIVEFAKGRALELGKPDIAAAVHEVWRESLTHPRLTALLEAAISQRATEKQNEEFRCYVKRAKQRLRDAQAKERKQAAKVTMADAVKMAVAEAATKERGGIKE